MKVMKDFSAFKLNKNQMGAMKGGARCTLTYDNGDQATLVNEDMTAEEARRYVDETYGYQGHGNGLISAVCVD